MTQSVVFMQALSDCASQASTSNPSAASSVTRTVPANRETQKATMLWASGGLFQTLGVRAERGRLLEDADDQRGAAVVVLSHAFWQSRFGGDRRSLSRFQLCAEVPLS